MHVLALHLEYVLSEWRLIYLLTVVIRLTKELFIEFLKSKPRFFIENNIISRPAHRREIIICTMCVRACVCHAVFSETTTVTHFW